MRITAILAAMAFATALGFGTVSASAPIPIRCGQGGYDDAGVSHLVCVHDAITYTTQSVPPPANPGINATIEERRLTWSAGVVYEAGFVPPPITWIPANYGK